MTKRAGGHAVILDVFGVVPKSSVLFVYRLAREFGLKGGWQELRNGC